jgi:hypothetical protein
MTRLARLGCSLLLGAFLWSALVPASPAQQMHTLTIRDGIVYVDGQQLSADQMPENLDLDGVTARYQFVGIQRPVIELKGRLFAVKKGLHQVSEDDVNPEKSSVILQEIETSPSASSDERTATRAPSNGPRSAKSARTAHQQYLSDVQKANRELYKRLVRERSMEKQAQDLARVVRMLPEDSDERQAKVDTLRALLNNIFELKQENRRREIERLQREIQELQKSLQKRKQMREEMINHRLRQLLNQ